MTALDEKLDRGRPTVRRPRGGACAARGRDGPRRAAEAGSRARPARTRRRRLPSPRDDPGRARRRARAARRGRRRRGAPVDGPGRGRSARSGRGATARGPQGPAAASRSQRRSRRHPRDPGRRRAARRQRCSRRALPDVRPLRRAAPLHARAPEPQRDRHRRHQGGDRPGPWRRRVQPAEVRGRRPPRPAHPRDRVVGTDPHLDRDGHRPARGRRGRDRHR